MTTTKQAGWKALAAGLLVTIAGPPLGALGLLIVSLLDKATFARITGDAVSTAKLFFQEIVPFAYIFVGIPALIAGVTVGIAIYRFGRIGWAYSIGLAVILGILATFTVNLIQNGIIVMPSLAGALFFIGPAVFASIVLRILIVKFSWMRGPEASAQPVAKT